MARRDEMKLVLTGLVELDRALVDIASEQKPRSVNKAMRKITRQAAKEIVLTDAVALVAVAEGFLQKQLKAFAAKRSRSKFGYRVGFRDPLFQGETFYGGFIEFGHETRSGSEVPPDSFLREALYTNTRPVRSFVRREMKDWVRRQNNKRIHATS